MILLVLFMLFSGTADAAEHPLQPKGNTKIQVPIDIEKGAMIILPASPLSVTGKTMPNFQVEVIGEKVMVTPLRVGARTNLFIDLGDNTIATLELVGVAGGGEDLINLSLGERPSKTKQTTLERVAFPTDLKFLAGPWQIQRISKKSKSGGVTLKINAALAVGDFVLLNFSVAYEGDGSMTVNDILTLIQTMGGLGGKTVIESQTVPCTVVLHNSTLTKGETSTGTLILQRVQLEYDQVLAVRAAAGNSPGPEVQISL